MISSETFYFNRKILNLVIFSDLANFFVNLMIFAQKPMAAQLIKQKGRIS